MGDYTVGTVKTDSNTFGILQIVAFAVLMESDIGIIGKSPDYIKEKFYTYMNEPDANRLYGILDMSNRAKFAEWQKLWGIEIN